MIEELNVANRRLKIISSTHDSSMSTYIRLTVLCTSIEDDGSEQE